MDPVWITFDGDVIPLSEMDFDHLQATITHVQNHAKAKTMAAYIRARLAGNDPGVQLDWKMALPRIYDHLISEAEKRRRRTALDQMKLPSGAWLDRWGYEGLLEDYSLAVANPTALRASRSDDD